MGDADDTITLRCKLQNSMEGDLLRREQEFHKINSELEERTSRLLQEIDAAKVKRTLRQNRRECRMSKGRFNDSNSRFANSSTISHPKFFSLKNDTISTELTHNEESGSISSRKDIIEDPLAIRSNGLGYEATNRLLRAKLTILNKEVDSLRQDYKQKSEECRKITAELNRSDEENARLESSLSSARECTSNTQSKLESSLQQLTKMQAENSALNKELLSAKKELKNQKQQSSATELRLNRALEDIGKLQNTAKQNRLQAKEDGESQRKNCDQLQLKIKGLERQRSELLSICTKQSHLIDNLHRQKAHLEVTRFVQTAEAEFDNILDWCLKSEDKSTKANS